MKIKFWKSTAEVIIISSLFFCSVSSISASESKGYVMEDMYQEPELLPIQKLTVNKLYKKTLTLQDNPNGGSGIKNNVKVSLEGSLATMFFTNVRYSEEKVGNHSRYGYVDIEGMPTVEGEVNVYLTYEDGAGNQASYVLPLQANFLPASPVTIRYIDAGGLEINSPKLISGNVGDNYDSSTDEYKLRIEGYVLNESQLPSNALGVLSEDAQTVTYVYDKIPTKAEDVKIVYLDPDGLEIHTPKLISGNIGDAYDSRTDDYKLLIEGYELDQSQLPNNSTGILSENPQTVRYIYHKIPVKAQDIRVIYLNSEGLEIHAPQFISGNIGDAYNVSTEEYKIKIEGYTLDESQLPKNAFGTLGETGQTITYVYKEIEITSGVVDQPMEKSFDDQDNKKITLISSRDLLPKTGERKNSSYAIFGLIILSLFGLMIGISKNKNVSN